MPEFDPYLGYGPMPGNITELHPRLKRLLYRKVWEKALEIFGWPMGILRWLYAGNTAITHLDGRPMLLSQTYQCPPSDLYRHLCRESHALEEKGQ